MSTLNTKRGLRKAIHKTGHRIQGGVLRALQAVGGDLVEDIIGDAARIATHSGRRTVRVSDVELANAIANGGRSVPVFKRSNRLRRRARKVRIIRTNAAVAARQLRRARRAVPEDSDEDSEEEMDEDLDQDSIQVSNEDEGSNEGSNEGSGDGSEEEDSKEDSNQDSDEDSDEDSNEDSDEESDEESDEDSDDDDKDQSGGSEGGKVRGAAIVLASLPAKTRGVFKVLAAHQQRKSNDDKFTGQFTGLPFHDFYVESRTKFLTFSEHNFKTLLDELDEHKIIVSSKMGAVDSYCINFNNEQIQRILRDMESTRHIAKDDGSEEDSNEDSNKESDEDSDDDDKDQSGGSEGDNEMSDEVDDEEDIANGNEDHGDEGDESDSEGGDVWTFSVKGEELHKITLDIVKMKYPSGAEYEGPLVNGKSHGDGTATFPGCGKYVGAFENGEQHGQGTYSYENGDKYDGAFENGEKNGQGTFTYALGGKYNGDTHTVMNWQGGGWTYNWRMGGKYDGEWAEGRYNGQGTLTYANGDNYEGNWAVGNPHGHGTFTAGDGGKMLEGEWWKGYFQGVVESDKGVKTDLNPQMNAIVDIENENEMCINGDRSGNYSREQLEKLLPFTYVLQKRAEVIGFVTVLMLDGKEDMETFKACNFTLGTPEGAKAKVMYIANIAVTKAERGKGYGAMLVEHALKQNEHRMVRYTRPEMHSEHIVGKVCRKQGYEYMGHPVCEGTYGDDSEGNPNAYRCILKAPRA
jgi:histone H3/H4/GNAT superfamily N-acetyltransferase